MPAAQHYQGQEGRRYHESKRAIPELTVPWVARLRAEKLQPYVRPTDVVLEYGVGYGWNLLELKCALKLGFDVSDFLRPELEKQKIEFVDAARSESCADVVICHHTLEHVLNPAQTLEEIRRILRPNGKLLLYVPFEKERRYRHFNSTEPNHHLYSWNVQTLGNLVLECGFTIESAGIGEFGYDRFAAKLALKMKLGERGFRLLRSAVHLVQPGLEVRVVAKPQS
jgi:SAM-dependent methyltransferase